MSDYRYIDVEGLEHRTPVMHDLVAELEAGRLDPTSKVFDPAADRWIPLNELLSVASEHGPHPADPSGSQREMVVLLLVAGSLAMIVTPMHNMAARLGWAVVVLGIAGLFAAIVARLVHYKSMFARTLPLAVLIVGGLGVLGAGQSVQTEQALFLEAFRACKDDIGARVTKNSEGQLSRLTFASSASPDLTYDRPRSDVFRITIPVTMQLRYGSAERGHILCIIQSTNNGTWQVIEVQSTE